MGGWVEGFQQWLAEQHESDCGPQLGQSWASLLITARIRPRLRTAFGSPGSGLVLRSLPALFFRLFGRTDLF